MGYEGEGKRGEEQRERVVRNESCLFERETEKRETRAASLKDLPASANEGGSGRGLSLKETEQPLQAQVNNL